MSSFGTPNSQANLTYLFSRTSILPVRWTIARGYCVRNFENVRADRGVSFCFAARIDENPVRRPDFVDQRAASRVSWLVQAFAIPLRMMTDEGELAFISTVTVFGTPIDVTVSELAIETFFPADEKTAEALDRRRES